MSQEFPPSREGNRDREPPAQFGRWLAETSALLPMNEAAAPANAEANGQIGCPPFALRAGRHRIQLKQPKLGSAALFPLAPADLHGPESPPTQSPNP
jgi:hypothetical protein